MGVGFRGWFLYIRSALNGWKLAGKAHPNIYEAVTLFQSEQATTEGIMQLAAGGLPVHSRRKYTNYEKSLVTIREKQETIA